MTMVDVNRLLGSLLSSGAAGGFAGGLAGGLASNMISGKSVKKLGSSALKLGGVAAVGALAYTAYRRYNNNQGAAPAEDGESIITFTSIPRRRSGGRGISC